MSYKIFEYIKSLGGKLYRGSKTLLKSIFANAGSILKLMGSLAIVCGGIFVHSYESKLSAVTLISEREQAQSQLRASMFSNLITPISGPSKEKEIEPHRERVLVELLALNFHEDFEFKPLMLHVDKRLSKRCNPNYDGENIITEEQAKQAKEDRASLRSIARRITSKQIKTLIKEKLPYPIEMLNFEGPIVKIEDFTNKRLIDKLIKEKIVVKKNVEEEDYLFFYYETSEGLTNKLMDKDFTADDISFVLNKFQKSFIKQNPIQVKREDFTNKRLIDKLIKEKIVVKKNVEEEDYLFFYYETSEELTNKLMDKNFTDDDISFVLNKFQKSFIKQNPIQVKREDFTNKRLLDKLIKEKIVVKGNGDNKDYLLFYYETSEELKNKLRLKDFTETEIDSVLNKFQESLIKQNSIQVKKEDFTDIELINRLITKRIVVEKNGVKENYLLFYHESENKLEERLEKKGFKKKEIDCVLDKFQESFIKQNPIQVKRKVFTNKGLIKRLITKRIVVEDNGGEDNVDEEDYLLFYHESENKLKERLEKKRFNKEERFDVLSRYSINLEKPLGGMFTLKIPGDENNRYLRVWLKNIDSYNETVEVNFNIVYVEDEVATDDTFTLTWYDFPFTDYTILNNGIRFSLILDKIDLTFKKDKKSIYEVSLKIIWYPKDFFTAHERPINYKVFRKYLGISD